MVPFFASGDRADAQKRRPARTASAVPDSVAQVPQKKNLTRVNSSDTSEGSSITIFSDLPLNDYSAYRGGDRFYVLIPGADASRIVSGLRGRGFSDVRTQKRGNDVLVSFRLLAGATARVSQKFNRLEILITVPALVAANNQSNTTNTNTATQTDPTLNSGNANSGTSSSRTQSGSGTSTRNSGGSNPSTSSGTSSVGQNPVASNQNFRTQPDGILAGPDGQAEQADTTEFPPSAQTSPLVEPTPTPPVDQIAQLEPQPNYTTATSQDPVTAPATSTGSSFGAQVKQNWLFILLAIAVAGLVAWVVFARSRGDRSQVENRLETIRESRSETKAVAPAKRVIVPRATPPVVEPQPSGVQTKPTSAEDLIAPAIVAGVVADQLRDDSTPEVTEEKAIEPQAPVGVEQASEDVASLLAGQSYDEASIGAGNPEARQMVAAELLAALAGRNVVRQERAREAFVKHGYFDDATRTLRTAESPAERASAARSLGLVRDESGTPHLVAALEDPAPEVRRAAVESLAEVRDPAAVAPLEALRDREKNRKVPTALIQHAIEASVIGRMKTETPPPVVTSYATTPLTTDADSNPVVSEQLSPPSVSKSVETTPLSFETLEPLPPIEVVVDTPEENRESPLDFGTEPETVRGEEAGLRYGEVDLDATSDIEITHVNDAAILDTGEASKSEWVDVDVTQEASPVSSEARAAESAEVTEDVLWDEPTTEAPIVEITEDADELVLETVTDTVEPTTLPFDTGESVAAESTPVVDERGLDLARPSGKEIEVIEEAQSGVSAAILRRLASEDDSERAGAVDELGRIGDEDSFREVSAAFDDPSPNVRNSAARALFNFNPDRAASFTRALREGSPERRRNIGAALSTSGLANEAIGNLMGESREKTYDAFSLLFLMAKAGEVQPLMRAVEEHPNSEVRLAVVKLLALSGQQEILPAFRRLAVRGSLPTEVRSAVMEAIYQISSQSTGAA